MLNRPTIESEGMTRRGDGIDGSEGGRMNDSSTSSSTSSSATTTTASSIRGRRSDGGSDSEGEEGGVSVSEKNGILGIVLEVVEGGGWRGEYLELEEVVGRLEEEGEKGWMERKRG